MNNFIFKDCKKKYLIDLDSQYQFNKPRVNAIYLKPNVYDAGRAHTTIFNWEGLKYVQIDLSGILKAGMNYKIFDIQNLFSEPIIKDKFSEKKIIF